MKPAHTRALALTIAKNYRIPASAVDIWNPSTPGRFPWKKNGRHGVIDINQGQVLVYRPATDDLVPLEAI